MKKYLILVFCFCLAKAGLAQQDTSLIYLRFPTIPPFCITKVSDSTSFTKEDLSQKKSTIIFVFSPDCEHCQRKTKEFLENMDLFKKVQIIMASPLEHEHIKKFYDEYKIADYPNIIMGRDAKYLLGTFYKIRSFPAIFLYDKKGNFVKAFTGNDPVKEIAEYL